MHVLRIGEITTFLRKSCAYIAHWRKKYNLVQILCIYCALGKEVQSCTNLPHILCIGERSTILHKSCTNLAHILRIDTSNAQVAHLAHLAQNTISPLLDHVTEITYHLFKSVQFDFEEGNLRSGSGNKLLLSFAIATEEPDCAFEINKPRPPLCVL